MTDQTTPEERAEMIDYLANTTSYPRGQAYCDCCGGRATDPPGDPEAIDHDEDCVVRIAWRLFNDLEAAEARPYREDGSDIYWVHETKAIRIDADLDLHWSTCESCGVQWPAQQMFIAYDEGMTCPPCLDRREANHD